jgi:phosphoribosylamine---glycine ligase
MKVLVLGGGGREHALCWALDRAASVDTVLCAHGNAGIAEVADLRAIDATDGAAVVALARDEAVDLVVIGPEAPLVAGVADALREAGIDVFGPTADGARIEGSKTFAKDVMAAAGVPTAAHWSGSDPAEARAALDRFAPPYVVKADGLAAGKGVRICAERAEAEEAIDDALVAGAFGEAGATLVIEEFLHGPEVSLFGLCDGTTVVPLVPAQDFKRALDGDEGLNTGGMGAYSPVPAFTPDMVDDVTATVLQPTLDELGRRGTPFVGVLYAGLVLTDAGPRVLEFNARFGDPETQVVLPRLVSDLGQLLLACARGELADHGPLEWDGRACVTVVLASGGYPEAYATGKAITGLGEAAGVPSAVVFHAGTRLEGAEVVTAGGRVLAVSGLAESILAARALAYTAADAIAFDGLHRRGDIAATPTCPAE